MSFHTKYQERKLIRKRKSATTCATSPKRGLLASSDEILEGDDIPGQSTSADRTLFKSKEIQSKDENIQLQPFKTSNSSKNAPRIGTRKSSSKRNIQQNQSTDYMDDEFDTFAKDIAFQLRQLPYYNALQCQEKIKRIINQERFIVQQFRHQEIETIIIKKEPGFNEEEPLQPVSSQETIQTIIKEEPLISEDEYPHPVLGYGTIYNENPDISEEEHSHTVSGQGTIQTLIKEEPMLNEYEYPHPISDHGTIQTTLNQNPAISEKELSQPVSSQETINRLKEQLREKMSSSIRSRNNTDYNIYHTPPETLNKTENFSSDIESVMID